MAGTILVSFCLFGKDPEDVYYRGAIRNAEMYAHLRPGWLLFFYLGASIPDDVKERLAGFRNVRLIDMSHEPEDQTATYWRFLALKDPWFSHFLSRDVDSRPGPRELDAVEEWMGSGQEFHVMRDHPRHGAEMLAGLWGCTQNGARRISVILPDRLAGDFYQVDQVFLRQRVWRFASRSLMAHIGCQWQYGAPGLTRLFSRDRDADIFFVAECHNGDDTLRFPEHRREVPGYVPFQNETEVFGRRT